MRIVFLFGAGASAFCGPCSPSNPPLGKDLFGELERGGLLPDNLPADVAALFRQSSNFEIGMAKLAAYDSTYFAPFVRGMARFFAPYRPTLGNLYLRLFRRLAALTSRQHQLIVATLNYENLLEHALLEVGVKEPNIIKPHGSCGFLPDVNIPGRNTIYFKGMVHPTTSDRVLFDIRNVVELDPQVIDAWCRDPDNLHLSPAMSFYAPGKVTTINDSTIERHRNTWRKVCSEMSETDLCFIIGTACNPADGHIWEPLAQAQAQARLIYVNPLDEGFAAWCTAAGRANDVHIRRGFEEALSEIIVTAKRPQP